MCTLILIVIIKPDPYPDLFLQKNFRKIGLWLVFAQL